MGPIARRQHSELMQEGSLDSLESDSRTLGHVKRRGFQFKSREYYAGQDWFTYEFPDKPSKFYIFNLAADWSDKVYTRVRLVDRGGIDQWQGGIDYWHSKL